MTSPQNGYQKTANGKSHAIDVVYIPEAVGQLNLINFFFVGIVISLLTACTCFGVP